MCLLMLQLGTNCAKASLVRGRETDTALREGGVVASYFMAKAKLAYMCPSHVCAAECAGN